MKYKSKSHKALFTVGSQDINEWFIDSRSSSHMTPYIENLDQPIIHEGVDQVTVGNKNIISIAQSIVCQTYL